MRSPLHKVQTSTCFRVHSKFLRASAITLTIALLQGVSAGLTTAWADGCFGNHDYCVVSYGDDLSIIENQHTLRSAVAEANVSTRATNVIGFADSLFGISRDSSGQVTASTASSANPVVITLESTLEVRSNLTITAPDLGNSAPILTIKRGVSTGSGEPLIAINSPNQAEIQVEGADTQVKIENITIDSNSNPNFGSGTRSEPGVAIEVNQTIVTTPEGDATLTPELVIKDSQIINSVSKTGGAAITSSGDVRVEGSTLTGNSAITPDGGAATNGGAINAEGTVTVLGSALNMNTATGDGGAIAASSVIVALDDRGVMSQLDINSAQGNGGAISASGDVSVTQAQISNNRSGQAAQSEDTYVVSSTGGNGGAINSAGNVTITDSVVSENSASGSGSLSASGDGGAIFAAQSVTVLGSTISSNTADGSGGAINAQSVIMGATTTATEISSNYASSNGGAISASESVTAISSSAELEIHTVLDDNWSESSGGAISASGSVELHRTQVTDSLSQNHGGAIFAGGNVIVEDSVLSRNIAGGWYDLSPTPEPTSIGGDGGAIYADSSVTVLNSTLELNQALEGFISLEGGNGGAIFSWSATSVNGSALNANSADYHGGAIRAWGPVTVENSTFGAVEILNPDFNPVVSIEENLDRDTRQTIDNPDFNPQITEPNPDYNIDVPQNRPNPNYGLEIMGWVPNPDCNLYPEYLDYDGQCFFMGTDRGDGQPIRYPLQVSGLVIDTQETEPNPDYDSRETITYLLDQSKPLDWRSLITNPAYSPDEFIEILQITGEPKDEREYIDLGNNAGQSGGAIFNNGSLYVSESTFVNNFSWTSGGAIYLENYGYGEEIPPLANSSISNSSFSHNFSKDSSGGALYIDNQLMNIEGTEFFANSSYEEGGAIGARDSELNIQSSSFLLNESLDNDGGALDVSDTQLTISDTHYFGNRAADDGGAIFSTTLVTVVDGSFVSNEASDNGGAIDADIVRFARVTFESNTALTGDGGAINLGNDGQSLILNSSFLNNTAPEGLGGALRGSSWMLFNDLIDNEASQGGAVALTGTIGTMLVGNLLQASRTSEGSLCTLPFWNSPDNIATDESCFGDLYTNGTVERPSSLSSDNPIDRESMAITASLYTDPSTGFVQSTTLLLSNNALRIFAQTQLEDYQSTPIFLEKSEELQALTDAISYLNTFYPQTDHNPDFAFCPDINNFYNECWSALNSEEQRLQATFSEADVDALNIEYLSDLVGEAGTFLSENLPIDSEQMNRSSSLLWTPGAVQIAMDLVQNNDAPTNNLENQENLNRQQDLITNRLSTQDNVVSELEKELEKQKLAAKLAKKLAAAQRAAERAAKLTNLKLKMESTKARGIALKEKQSWIILMRNFIL